MKAPSQRDRREAAMRRWLGECSAQEEGTSQAFIIRGGRRVNYEVYLFTRIRLCEAAYLENGNPLHIFTALNYLAIIRAVSGAEIKYPSWVSAYLIESAYEILHNAVMPPPKSITSVERNKNVIKALRLKTKRGSSPIIDAHRAYAREVRLNEFDTLRHMNIPTKLFKDSVLRASSDPLRKVYRDRSRQKRAAKD